MSAITPAILARDAARDQQNQSYTYRSNSMAKIVD